MILTPAQQQIASDLHRFRVVNCGRRFGKTTLAIDQMKACAVYRTVRIAYIAPTFQQARDIAWEALKRDFSKAGAVINESRLEIRVRNLNGEESLIMLRGWESVENLRGQAFDLIVIDEVASMRNFWEAWQEVIRPTLTDRKGEVLFISTPKGYNHFFDLFNLEQTDSDFKSFHFTSYDNTFIPVEEIDAARAQMTEDRFAQEYLADFRKTEGVVYKEFNRLQHIYDELPQVRFVETIAGIDFGFTHPAVVQSLKVDYDGNYWLTGEWSHRGKTDAEVAEYAASRGFNKVYPDPENAAGVEELVRHGVNVREVNKGPGSVVGGVQIVRELLKANRLRIHRSCVKTINGFETYSYPPKKAGATYENENPEKEDDDEMDALRYALMMHTVRSTGDVPRAHYAKPRVYGGSIVHTKNFPRMQ